MPAGVPLKQRCLRERNGAHCWSVLQPRSPCSPSPKRLPRQRTPPMRQMTQEVQLLPSYLLAPAMRKLQTKMQYITETRRARRRRRGGEGAREREAPVVLRPRSRRHPAQIIRLVRPSFFEKPGPLPMDWPAVYPSRRPGGPAVCYVRHCKPW